MVKNSKFIINILLVMVLLCQACGHSEEKTAVSGASDSSSSVLTSTEGNLRKDSESGLSSSTDRSSEDNSGIEKTISEESENTNLDSASKDSADKDNADDDSSTTEISVNEEQENTEKETSDMTPEISSEDFYITTISDEIFARMKGKSYKDECNVPIEDLRYIHILHKDLEGSTKEGEMVCHEVIAQDLLEIFEELYLNNYPIERVELVDEYDADDETSMTANNSSCFNYRCISHTTTISKHGLGIAVDINPLYNPYTKIVNGTRTVEPAAGAPYLDRDADFPYKIDENDLCYKLFIEHGFEWGGSWTNSKDYQHFEMPDSVAKELRAKYQ